MAKQASKLKGYDNIFAQRLRALMKERSVTQDILAEKAGCSRQAVSQYMDGSSAPNVDKLLSIADFFNVSADYLLGRTNAETTDKDLRYICDYTGLNETALEVLHYWHFYGEDLLIIPTINLLLETEKSTVFEQLEDGNTPPVELPEINKLHVLSSIEQYLNLKPTSNDREVSIAESGKLISLSETYPEYAKQLRFDDLLSVVRIKESEVVERIVRELLIERITMLKKERDPHGNHHETQ